MEREGGFLKYERVENTAHESSYIYFLHRCHIYIYTLSYFKKIKNTTSKNTRKIRIVLRKINTGNNIWFLLHIILRLIKKIHICVSQNYSVVVVSASGNGG